MSHGMLLSVKNLSISSPDRCLFSDLSFSISRGEAVSLIGPNGSGKTTLLRHILQETALLKSDDSDLGSDFTIHGHLSIARGAVIANLDQQVTPDSVAAGNTDSPPEGVLSKLLHDFGLTLDVDGLTALSAGMLQKLAIAKLLARQADFYLLDEPSNYLDLPGIVALEHHILQQTKRGVGFLVITHDRELSDRISNHTVYLAPEGIYLTTGGATAALELKEHDILAREHESGVLARKISALEQDFRTKAGWAQQKENSKRGAGGAKGYISHKSAKMARRAKAVQKRIKRKQGELDEAKPFVPKRVKLSLPSRDVARRSVFGLENCSYRYSESNHDRRGVHSKWAVDGVSLGATTKDKICLMGGNGAGKSTLLKLATGRLKPLRGDAYQNDNVKVSVIPQGLSGYFSCDRLLDNFAFEDISESIIRQYLGAALLRREMVLRSTTELSQGELVRAALVHAILTNADFLFMDEPTSHLDLESVIVLENLLQSFSGGFMIVSHDRALVSSIANQLYYLEGSRLRLA